MPSNFHHMAFHKAGVASLKSDWQQAERLGGKHFAQVIALAFALHALALCAWMLAPKTEVVEVPVRVLNIKLGDGTETAAPALAAQPQPENNKVDVENTITRLVRDPKLEAARSEAVVKSMEKLMGDKEKAAPAAAPKAPAKKPALKSKPFDMRSEGVNVAAPVMAVEYVRGDGGEKAPSLGGSKSEIVSRYERLISSWIDKFKPSKLLAPEQPARATALVRIRIDRRGNIRHMDLERSTEYVMLDRAAIDTVRRANPVPAVPDDYPAGDSFEFILPIVFLK